MSHSTPNAKSAALTDETGVDIVWLIDPIARTLEAFDGERNGEVHSAGVLEPEGLPGLRLDLAQLFAALDDA